MPPTVTSAGATCVTFIAIDATEDSAIDCRCELHGAGAAAQLHELDHARDAQYRESTVISDGYEWSVASPVCDVALSRLASAALPFMGAI